jgi:hypothetical protein
VSLKLWSNDGDRCREALGTGECHFIICHFDPRMSKAYNTSRLRSQTLAHDRLIPASRPDARDDHSPVLSRRREAKVPSLPTARARASAVVGPLFRAPASR